MAKKTRIEGYTVAAFVPAREVADWVGSHTAVRLRAPRGPEAALDEANAIKEAIVRHLRNDHPDVRGPIDVEAQVWAACEHCNAQWTEKNDTYNGGCCDKDEEANPRAEAA